MTRARLHPPVFLLIALAVIVCSATRADEGSVAVVKAPTPEQIRFFEIRIRPLLAENCFKCHGEEKQEENLRLDSRASALAGGDRGPAVVPGKPDESLLIKAVKHLDDLEMPPKKQLPREQ